jgi:tetratricopeptide (TPR) repeat protein
MHPLFVARLCLIPVATLALLAIPGTAGAATTLADVEAAFHAGDYETSAKLAQEQVDRGIWNERWPIWLIECQLTKGQYEEARKTFESVIGRYPTSLTLRALGIEALRQNGQTDLARREEREFFRVLQSAPSRFSSRDNLIAAGRYFVDQGEDARQVLKLFYDRVRDADPKYVESYLATAELAIDKGDYQVAAETLERAAELDQADPRIPYLTARAWQPSDPQVASEALERALRLNPRHIPSLLYRADLAIDREQYDVATNTIEEALQVNPLHAEAIALQAVIAHLQGDYEQEKAYRQAALQSWAENPLVDHTIGKKLSDKYRFAEGAQYQRQAIEFDPRYTPAKFQLAQDLLRLGNDEEGWQIAGQVAREDEYNVVAHNLITLHDRLQKFQILEADGIVVRMDTHEADIYGQQVLRLLAEAKLVLCEKYDVVPRAPIVVEIFPEQKDFAIRTFGLPGGAGFLGVCFGRVITANSPASQGQRPANWQSVLWHEFCHVVTLEKTKNRMPRWLSEGISVYEERQRNPAWGESMTPKYREMLLADDLIPVSQLSAAFLTPPSPLHLQFAYFHSSLVVEYLIDQAGIESLQAILDDLAAGMSINSALQRSVGSMDKLDVQFAEYAQRVANNFAAGADWSRPRLPAQPTIQQLQQWVEKHPASYWGLRALAELYLQADQVVEAEPLLEKLRLLGAVTGERGGVLEMLAGVYQQQAKTEQEEQILRELISLSSDSLPALQRLTTLALDDQRWDQALRYAQDTLTIQPLLPEPHLAIATAGEQLDRAAETATALRAVREMEPVDPAEIDFRLATALFALEELEPAKRYLLLALDQAPRYRDAHRLLLQIVDRLEEQTESGIETDETTAPDENDTDVPTK